MKARHLAGACLLYLVFLAATAPAGALFWALNRAGGSPVFVAEGVTGTLWRGEARRLGIVFRDRQPVEVGEIAWAVQPHRLLLGEAAAFVEIRGGGPSGRGMLGLDFHGMSLRKIELSLPAAWLASLQPGLEAWQAGGTIRVSSEEFLLRGKQFQGRGEILWDRAALGLSGVRPLGDYRAEVAGEGERIRFHLRTRAGPLEAQGDGFWSRRGMEFAGSARAREREAELRTLLGLMGAPQADGSRIISLSPGK